MIPRIKTYLKRRTETAPLAVFRIFFGLMMLISIIRFWAYGWIEKLYLEPDFHFSFYGFEWVQPLGVWTYLLFGVCGLSALMVAMGYRYRLSTIVFFLSFTYIELMDKTTYLNHYYFISILAFLMIFLPAGAYFSMDAYREPGRRFQYVPKWTVDSIRLLLGIVYVYAGLAKLNSDWMLHALPLKIWLPSKFDIPLIGPIMGQEWVHYTFSWAGALYDLCIPFLLLFKPTRWFAFVLVVIFHTLTRVLFPIGMFPYIMIVGSLIFFDAKVHNTILRFFSRLLRFDGSVFDNGSVFREVRGTVRELKLGVVAIFFAFQLLFPWRYALYPGELFWTEEGYRFSWRVMLMEKAGYAQFRIVEGKTGRWFYVDNSDFLTPLQEKQMSFQPDFILEYAHFLRRHFETTGKRDVQVYVQCSVALNGRLSKPYIDADVNLAEERESFRHKTWILPFEDEIKGL